MWLFLAFVAVPILEIALFIQVGGFLGLWPTLGIVVLTAIAGTLLVRVQGMTVLAELQQSLRAGADPVTPIAHGALILVAGVLLLTPGFFTDACGLSLLVPPVRAALIRAGAARMTGRFAVNVNAAPRTHRDDGVIDAEFTVEDVDADGPRGTSGWTRRD
ncbi:MAG: FxsA family protein [Pseudomonadota bacterium]